MFVVLLCLWATFPVAGSEGTHAAMGFPRPLAEYAEPANAPLLSVLAGRVKTDPFNAIATGMFFLAILHTFVASKFTRLAHKFEKEHLERCRAEGKSANAHEGEVSFKAEVFHFLGEVEAVFGIWIIPLLIAISIDKGWPTARDYVGERVNFTEPMFVLVIMTIAASRPILKLAEQIMARVAVLGRGSPAAWWVSILTLGPLLGSFITEPAAMTISALLLARKLYSRKPAAGLAYATLGLLFVNVSVGGVLTHFAAPPVLMVARKWDWGLMHMLEHFGWKAAAGAVVSTLVYLVWFRKEFKRLDIASVLNDAAKESASDRPVPVWITAVHVLFLFWTVLNNHFPALFLGGFLFYLAFTRATQPHQGPSGLRPALLVAFFLAGLVVHGGLQAWWIAPVLSRLSELPLFLGAATLTAFNDNAAITYLASLVPGFSDPLKYAVVAGAVAGGGLTVIANAPNPAGYSILSRFFPDGISPLRLFVGALLPTIIVSLFFVLFRNVG